MKKRRKRTKLPLCQCGCGKPVTKLGNKFLLGHNSKKENHESPSNNGKSNGRFKKGNKYGKGRPQGSRNAASIAIDATFEGEAERLTRKCIELALQGNVACLKTAIERIAPVKKSAPIKLEGMPVVDSVESACKASEFLLQSIVSGKISPIEGECVSRVLDKRLHALQIVDIEQQLEALKEKFV